MVGYYPQPLEGELLYSATARLAAAIFPGRPMSYCAARLLGNQSSSFGVLIPNHVASLLDNIPAVTALSKEVVLRASTFHLHAPLLDDRERIELKDSIFTPGATNGLRTFNARGCPTVLKYCVACAKRDSDLGRPAIWRVVHNHHGSVACAEHGILLQISDAPVASNVMCDPASWIRSTDQLPPRATLAEVAVARDFDWIYSQASENTPGFQLIARKLRDTLVNKPEFTRHCGFLDATKLLHAVQANLSQSTLSSVTYAALVRRLTRGSALPTTTRTTLHAYSLCAFLAGTSLRAILTDLAQRLPHAVALGPIRGASNEIRVPLFKERIHEFIAARPSCMRSHIISALGHAVDVVRSADPEWFEGHMPPSRSRKPGRRRLGYRNWDRRDEELFALISRHVTTGGVPFRSFRDALQRLDQPKGLLSKNKGRLPKSLAFLESLIVAKQVAA